MEYITKESTDEDQENLDDEDDGDDNHQTICTMYFFFCFGFGLIIFDHLFSLFIAKGNYGPLKSIVTILTPEIR